uniref:Putative secreted protein n=1 Tax=Anopheles marajoara TaxID=58244 RepID=A0A2M4CEB2_9DIPT
MNQTRTLHHSLLLLLTAALHDVKGFLELVAATCTKQLEHKSSDLHPVPDGLWRFARRLISEAKINKEDKH